MSSLRDSYCKLTAVDPTYAIAQTEKGNRFNCEKVFANVDTAVPLFLLFENPIDSGVVVRLQDRKLKSDIAGVINFQILWDYDVSTSTPIIIPKYNQNNEFRALKPGKAEVSLLNASTSPVNGNWVIGGIATILDEGIEREPNFIPTSGVGSNTTGDIAPGLGVRDYHPGTGFLTKLTSDANDNRILWGYDWFEVPC